MNLVQRSTLSTRIEARSLVILPFKMRRSGSSSCILRPKGTPEKEKETNTGTSEPPSPSLSVTLLSFEQLPSYSVERFYMLSELEIKAHSTSFLCDLDAEDQTHGTHETEDTSTGSVDANANDQPDFDSPPFVLLYLLWKPDMTSSAQTFAETTILETVTRLEILVDIVNSIEEAKRLRGGFIRPSSSNNLSGGAAQAAVTFDNGNKKSCSVYLIVDRVAPPEKKLWWSLDAGKAASARERCHQLQVNLAEELARKVAADPKLRHLCEGITVGVSNHERAAPGLEACVNAICIGEKDRRKEHEANPQKVSSTKSLMGVMAVHPDECLGLQSGDVTDAATDVLQSRVCAEWNGQGNLQTFSERARKSWRLKYGLLPEPEITGPKRRKIPRRRQRPQPSEIHFDEGTMDRGMQEMLVNVLAAIFIGFYMAFHFRVELEEFFWILNPKHWDDLVQHLREL